MPNNNVPDETFMLKYMDSQGHDSFQSLVEGLRNLGENVVVHDVCEATESSIKGYLGLL